MTQVIILLLVIIACGTSPAIVEAILRFAWFCVKVVIFAFVVFLFIGGIIDHYERIHPYVGVSRR